MIIPDKFKHSIQNIKQDNFYKNYKNVVLSCYFTGKNDPIHHSELENKRQNINNFNYIKPLYETCKEQNLHLIIFYDNLSNEFINLYQTDRIIFRQVNLISNLSINDERYIIYYEYLLENPYEKILTSDISDVYIIKNPFELFENYWIRDEKIEKEVKEIINGKDIKQSSLNYLLNNKFSNAELNKILNGYLIPNVSKEEKIFMGTNSIDNGPINNPWVKTTV